MFVFDFVLGCCVSLVLDGCLYLFVVGGVFSLVFVVTSFAAHVAAVAAPAMNVATVGVPCLVLAVLLLTLTFSLRGIRVLAIVH